MPLLKELGTAVRNRRLEMGLNQQQLADLAGLSRATVNGLESGKLKDLSSSRIERLANELGFAIGLVGTRTPKDRRALETAAQVASVPYAMQLPASVLLDSIKNGVVPPGYIPQIRTLLQEAPVSILADVAEELRLLHYVPPADTWKRMRAIATVLQCNRPLWQLPPT